LPPAHGLKLCSLQLDNWCTITLSKKLTQITAIFFKMILETFSWEPFCIQAYNEFKLVLRGNPNERHLTRFGYEIKELRVL